MKLPSWFRLSFVTVAIAVISLWLGILSASADDQPGATDVATFAPDAVCFAEDMVVAQPNVSIPDDSTVGVCANFPAMGAGTGQSVSLSVGADHPWVGDRKFSLVSPGRVTLTGLTTPGGDKPRNDFVDSWGTEAPRPLCRGRTRTNLRHCSHWRHLHKN